MTAAPRTHRFIRLLDRAMGRKEAEERVFSAFRALGFNGSKSRLAREGAPFIVDAPTAFAELVTATSMTGEVPGLDKKLWIRGQAYLSMAVETDAEGPTTTLSGGPRSSPPMSGPGYQTNDVVSDMLDSLLIYRREVADLSFFGQVGLRPCFRSYTAYLAACITAIDAFMNRQRWYALHEPGTTITDAGKKELASVVRPLDHKLRRWTPVLTGGKALDETLQPWSDYTALRVARNDYVHVNEPDARFELRPATETLNRCRFGVGQLLIELSALAGGAASPSMYRVRYGAEARFASKAASGEAIANPST